MKRNIFFLVTIMSLALPLTGSAESVPQRAVMMEQWCNHSVQTLRTAKQNAMFYMSSEQYGRAKNVLVRGLYDAQRRHHRPSGRQAWISYAIQRGLALTGTSGPFQGYQQSSAIAFFLLKYYDFIFEMANGIDYRFVLPFERCRNGYCQPDISIPEYEDQMVYFAKENVAMVLKHMARFDGEQVHPIGGQPRIFLKALSLALWYAAADFTNPIIPYPTKYACAIRELRRLSRKVRNYQSTYGSAYWAVQRAYFHARDILHRINARQDCRFNQKPGRPSLPGLNDDYGL